MHKKMHGLKHKNWKIELHHALSGIPYPANQKDILRYARNKGSDNAIISMLEELPHETYPHEQKIIDYFVNEQ